MRNEFNKNQRKKRSTVCQKYLFSFLLAPSDRKPKKYAAPNKSREGGEANAKPINLLCGCNLWELFFL